MRRTQQYAFLLLIVVAVVGGCRNDRPSAPSTPSTDLPDLLADPLLHTLTVGLDELPSEFTLGIIRGAAIANDGSIVLLDRLPPYIKVFDSEGTPLVSFLQEGDGPGEVNEPSSVFLFHDSIVGVTDAAGFLSLSTIDGSFIRKDNISAHLLATTEACNSILGYGPVRTANGRTISWLARIDGIPSSPHLVSIPISSDTTQMLMIPIGTPSLGIARSPDGQRIILRHDLSPQPAIFEYTCNSERALRLTGDQNEALPTSLPSMRQTGDRIATMAVPPKSPMGLAELRNHTLVANRVNHPRDPSTELVLMQLESRDHAGVRKVVPGAFALLGTYPGVGILFLSDDPVPHIFAIREDDLLAAFD